MDEKIKNAFLKFKNSGKIEDYLEYRKIVNEIKQKR